MRRQPARRVGRDPAPGPARRGANGYFCYFLSISGGGSNGPVTASTISSASPNSLARRAEAYRMNAEGWAGQLRNVAKYLGESR